MKLRLGPFSLQKKSPPPKSLASRVVALVVTLLTYSASAQSNSSETTCSLPFQTKGDLLNRAKIEILESADIKYLNQKNGQVIELSKKFKNLQTIKHYLRRNLIASTKALKAFGHAFTVETENKNFIQTVYKTTSGKKQKLFSTSQIDKPNGRTRILTLSISPNGSVAVIHTRDGSIDRKFITFLSASGEILRTLPVDSNWYGWINPSTFVMTSQFHPDEPIRNLEVRVNNSLKTIPFKQIKDSELTKVTTYGDYSYADMPIEVESYEGSRRSAKKLFFTARFNIRTGEFVIVNTPLDDDTIFAGTYKSKRYIINRSGKMDVDQTIFIEELSSQPPATEVDTPRVPWSRSATMTLPFSFDYIDSAYIQESNLSLNLWINGKNYLTLIDLDTNSSRSVPIPDAHRLVDSTILTRDKVKVTLSSAIHSGITLTYDFTQKKFVEDLSQLFMKDDTEYVTEIVRYKSFDGTEVPMRLAYRKDIKKFGQTPVYIEAYGDYNSPGPYTSQFSEIEYAFMRDGGLLAFPAIRGGGELGIKWHKAGMLNNRERIYEDLASSAKYLIENNFTSASRITLSGTSAGGLSIATTALKFPKYFGLVIPANGPMDIERHAELRNAKTSWYAVHRPENLAIWQNLSPIRNATNIRDLNFLFLLGRMDTRVNPHHSLLMAQELEKYAKNPDQVLLLSSNHAGHFSFSPSNSGHIGIFQASMKWAYIYHLMGMKFGQ